MRILICAITLLVIGPSAAYAAKYEHFKYKTHDGIYRDAYLVLPSRHINKPLALIISPHGRAVSARNNCKSWGNLPDYGRFAVICPNGYGRKLSLYSWGYRGQIEDLSKMPSLLRKQYPNLKINSRKVYAFGSSMGGQETLLLLAEYPGELAGAVAFDPVTDLILRYKTFPSSPQGNTLLPMMAFEVGGTPDSNPGAFLSRSPLYYASSLAKFGTPLQLWWSKNDTIVPDQEDQSGAFFNLLKSYYPKYPLEEIVGTWPHSNEFNYQRCIPVALMYFNLLTKIPKYDCVT